MIQLAGSSQYRHADISPPCSVRDAMLAAIPNVRAFARSMCRNSDQADVLVQKALLCGWSSIDSLESGTNMTAWLITILRRFFYLSYRTERRSLQLSGSYAGRLSAQPARFDGLVADDLPSALQRLPAQQREAVILIEASRYSYEEAARICRCPVGTIKSRASRGRARLAECLSIKGLGDFGLIRASADRR
jgi:RNA polymerase sigma-70 factor (ECF subfamily)